MSDKEKGKEPVGEALSGYKTKIEEAVLSNFSSDKIMETFDKVEASTSNIQKYMGVGAEMSDEIRSAMTDAASKIISMGGSMENLETIQQGLLETTGRNVIASNEYFSEIYAAAEVSGQSMKTLQEGFINAGYNMNNIGSEMQTVLDTSRALGVSMQAVSAGVLDNMKSLDTHNFKGGVEGLAKMAATSATLRVNMSSMMQAVDKAFDPEGAIEMASAFQRLGVTQSELLDPLKLMNMSMNDPEQFMKSISDMGKSLTELDEKGNIRIAPGSIRRMKKLAEAAGMNVDEFAKMSKASAELDIKMQKISFPDFASEEQKTMIANISQMKDGKIQMKVDGEMKDVNEVLQQFKGDQKGLKDFLESSQPKTLEELALEQLTTSKAIEAGIDSIANKTGLAFAGSKTGGKIRQAERKIVRAGTDAVSNTFDVSKLRQGFDNEVGVLTQSLIKLSKGEGSLTEVGQSLSTVLNDVKGGFGSVYEDLKKNLGTEEQKLLSSTNEFVQMLNSTVVSGADFFSKNEKLGDVDKKISPEKTNEKKNLQVDMSKIRPENNVDVFKKIETNSGLTKEQVMEMSSLSAKENLSGEIVLTVKVDTSDSESKAKLERLLQSDTQVRELLVKAITNAKTNDGRKGYMSK
jgi:hypothetical protein